MSSGQKLVAEVLLSTVESKRKLAPGQHPVRNALLCALIFATCFWITWPVADLPFFDDWSYIKSAQLFAQTGHFVYNGWAAAMLGWQIPWGAFFIRFFGFSFMAVKLSTFPLAVTSVFIFYLIQARFGINTRNAVIGTLTLGLSPLFLPMAASYMSDVPGLFVILICLYFCQRAVAARSSAAAIAWLSLATASDVVGGTVRQIVWLGALVMVPSTAWLLRNRRGVLAAASVLWAGTFLSVLYFMHWFAKQPYAIHEAIFARSPYGHVASAVVGASTEGLAVILCLLLGIFPVLAPWLSRIRAIGNANLLKLAGVLLAWTGFQWSTQLTLPFFSRALLLKGAFPEPARFPISLLLVATAFVFGVAVRAEIRRKAKPLPTVRWRELVWMIGPFSLSYCLLLLPRLWRMNAYDRYALDLMPFAIVILSRLYQDGVAPKLPASSIVTFALLALLALAGTHDWFASQRAQLSAIAELRSAGVPRTEIQASFEYDGWTQVKDGGHANDPRIEIPHGAYTPAPAFLRISTSCNLQLNRLLSAIHPKYVVATGTPPCLIPTAYRPVQFSTWFPPFRRTMYVRRVPEGAIPIDFR